MTHALNNHGRSYLLITVYNALVLRPQVNKPLHPHENLPPRKTQLGQNRGLNRTPKIRCIIVVAQHLPHRTTKNQITLKHKEFKHTCATLDYNPHLARSSYTTTKTELLTVIIHIEWHNGHTFNNT